MPDLDRLIERQLRLDEVQIRLRDVRRMRLAMRIGIRDHTWTSADVAYAQRIISEDETAVATLTEGAFMPATLTEDEVNQRHQWLRAARQLENVAIQTNKTDEFEMFKSISTQDGAFLRNAIAEAARKRAEVYRNAALTGIPPEFSP